MYLEIRFSYITENRTSWMLIRAADVTLFLTSLGAGNNFAL